jgi:adenylyltransferase/sulfurtransferase
MTIVPGETPCLRCVLRESPPPGTTPTCDTAGILGPIVNVVASFQACEAIKILSGRGAAISRTLNVIDLWENRLRQINIDSLRAAQDCPTCHGRQFPWLEGRQGSHSAVLCGRNAVQLTFAEPQSISLEALQQKLQEVGVVTRNPFLLRLEVDRYRLTVFPDGRAIIGGTDDIAEARTIYARYIGS